MPPASVPTGRDAQRRASAEVQGGRNPDADSPVELAIDSSFDDFFAELGPPVAPMGVKAPNVCWRGNPAPFRRVLASQGICKTPLMESVDAKAEVTS